MGVVFASGKDGEAVFAPELVDEVNRLLRASPRFPCVLLVHREIRKLQTTRDALLAGSGWYRLSVAAAICEQIVAVEPARRGDATQGVLVQAVASAPGVPLLLDEIDILFEPGLHIEPLATLRNCSRHKPLIVLWPGDYVAGVLSYAVPEHAHYRRWSRSELCDRCVIPL